VRRRVRQYTSFPSARAFDAFVDLLNAGGVLDAVDPTMVYSSAPAAADGTDASSSDDDAGSVVPLKKRRLGARALSPKEAIFFVLFRCRTGLDIIDCHALFGIEYSVACRYFAVYISFLRVWLEAEFPSPTPEQLDRACPLSFKVAFPDRKIQMIIDAHEQQCEEPSNLMARRTVWSDYKHRTTNKFFGACSPCGACVFASTNYGGKCDDRTLTLNCGVMDLLLKNWTTLADKGFMLHAEYADAKHQHELFTPSHAQAGVKTYSADESRWTNAVGKTRIHVERMFKRAQEWKILHTIIKISAMDLAGSIFKVCCFMGNFEPPLIRQEGEPLRSLAEVQWGRE
jgi:hypothetical protein